MSVNHSVSQGKSRVDAASADSRDCSCSSLIDGSYDEHDSQGLTCSYGAGPDEAPHLVTMAMDFGSSSIAFPLGVTTVGLDLIRTSLEPDDYRAYKSAWFYPPGVLPHLPPIYLPQTPATTGWYQLQ
jgi:hypothetical protein